MYGELVKALRHCIFGDCRDCGYYNNCANLAKEAADAIEELQKALDDVNDAHNEGYDVGYWAGRRDYEPKWVPVTERLPDQGKRYLVIRFDEVTKTQFIDILWHDAHDLWWNRLYKGQYNVTHWMPLPSAPTEG